MMFGGAFGQKRRPYGMQDYSAGTMPGATPTANMGLDTSVPTDPNYSDRPNGGILNTGATWNDVGRGALAGVADGIAQWAGQKPMAVPALLEAQQSQAAAAQAERLAALKAQLREPTALQRNFEYLGIDPNTSQGRQIGIDSIVRPTIIGNPEMGYYGSGGSYGAPSTPTTQVVDGKTYYYVNGQWYDNAEGK